MDSLYIAQPVLLVIFFLLLLLGLLIKYRYYKPVVYVYPLGSSIKKLGYTAHIPHHILKVLRLSSLIALVVLIGSPQWVDKTSKVRLEGIDIMLALDASVSMICFDSLSDPRSRFDVAKQEAISFVKKRENDLIGLVVFGKDAVSRCPLTLDKQVLSEIIDNLELGDIEADATVLSIGLTMAINRLKNSKATSKVIILLTDGEPTPGLDIDPKIPISMAQKLGIKIYTIGVGNPTGAYVRDPIFGVRQVIAKLNIPLLKSIAHETGGKFFLASQPQDLKNIYSTIDTLEKTKHETDIFARYLPIIIPFVLIAAVCLILEFILSRWIWFTI